MRVRSADDGSSTDSRNHPLRRVPGRLRGAGDLVAGHDLVLDVLGPADRRLVVLQVVGELEEEAGGRAAQLVVGVAAHLVGEVHQLAVDTVADEVVHPARRPGRRVALDHPLDDLARVQRPLERPVGEQLQQRFLPVLLPAAWPAPDPSADPTAVRRSA